eukprot:gene24349-29432_t
MISMETTVDGDEPLSAATAVEASSSATDGWDFVHARFLRGGRWLLCVPRAPHHGHGVAGNMPLLESGSDGHL